MRIAFDIDDTIWKVRALKVGAGDCVLGCVGNNHECDNYSFDQIPDYDLIQVLLWFAKNGDEVYVWSAGGTDYAKVIMTKLGLNGFVTIVDKKAETASYYGIDLTFDDQEVLLGKVNVKVKR